MVRAKSQRFCHMYGDIQRIEGLEGRLFRRVPLPRRKKFHSLASIIDRSRMVSIQIKNAKMSLCASNRPRDTLVKVSKVTFLHNVLIRVERLSDVSDSLMVLTKRFLKYFNEKWYMGSISAKSAITK